MESNLDIPTALSILMIIGVVAWLVGEAYKNISVANIGKDVFGIGILILILYMILMVLPKIK